MLENTEKSTLRPNWALLRKELEHITGNLKEWNQNIWGRRTEQCGTVGCLAGNTVIRHGNPVWDDHNYELLGHLDGPGQSIQWTSDAAANLLGLSNRVANDLFSANNTLRDLWELASFYSRGEVQVPDLSHVGVEQSSQKRSGPGPHVFAGYYLQSARESWLREMNFSD